MAGALRGARVDFEFAAAQLFPKMLAQRLLVDLELIGDFGLGDANGRSALHKGALFGSRLIRLAFPLPRRANSHTFFTLPAVMSTLNLPLLSSSWKCLRSVFSSILSCSARQLE